MLGILKREKSVPFLSKQFYSLFHTKGQLFLLPQVLELTSFNKRRQTANQRGYIFPCLLKFSKAQINDKAFRVSDIIEFSIL